MGKLTYDLCALQEGEVYHFDDPDGDRRLLVRREKYEIQIVNLNHRTYGRGHPEAYKPRTDIDWKITFATKSEKIHLRKCVVAGKYISRINKKLNIMSLETF